MDSKEPERFSWIDDPSIVVRHYGSIDGNSQEEKCYNAIKRENSRK